jgi:hypothetical protein
MKVRANTKPAQKQEIGWFESFLAAFMSSSRVFIVGFLLASPWILAYLLVILQIFTLARFMFPSPDAYNLIVIQIFASIFPPSPFTGNTLGYLYYIGAYPIREWTIGGTPVDLIFLFQVFFSFMVYVSFVVSFVKNLAAKNNMPISWKRCYIVAIKSVSIGFMIGFITLSIASALFTSSYMMEGLYFGGWYWALARAGATSFSELAGFWLTIAVFFVFLLAIVYAAIYTILSKFYIFKTLKLGSIGWRRAFFISLKARLVGLLLEFLLLTITISVSTSILWAVMQASIPVTEKISNVVRVLGIFLIVTVILMILPSLASFLKYLNEEITSRKLANH